MAPSAIAIQHEYSAPLHLRKSSFADSTPFATESHGSDLPKRLIGNALKKRVESVDPDTCEAGDEDSFFVADLGEVYRQHLRWKLNLPRVKPHYGEFGLSLLPPLNTSGHMLMPRCSG